MEQCKFSNNLDSILSLSSTQFLYKDSENVTSKQRSFQTLPLDLRNCGNFFRQKLKLADVISFGGIPRTNLYF